MHFNDLLGLEMSLDLVHSWHRYKTVIAAGATAFAGVAALAYYLLKPRHRPVPRISIDFNDQSVVIDGKPEHRASRLSTPPDYFHFDSPVHDCTVVSDVLFRGKKLSNNGPCLGARTGKDRAYEWMTYQQVIDQVREFGSGLIYKGIKPQNNTFIGIYATNRPEWTIADYGSHLYSMVPVPLYDTLGLDACKFIINQCEMQLIVVDSEVRVKNLMSLKQELTSLTTIVMIETVTEELKKSVEEMGLELLSFKELLALGRKRIYPVQRPKPDDLFSIIYTSGTTGEPKGVMVTHAGFITMVHSIALQLKPTFEPQPGERYLSYLPLAHNFDRTAHIYLLMYGGQIGYYSRDVRLLTDDLMTLRPTLFATVPRVLNRVYDAIMTEVKSSFIKSTLLRWALASKQKEIDKFIYRRDSFWDKLVLNKIQNKLGGRIRFVVTGSAPLSTEVLRFIRCALSCVVVEAYGQTESSAGLTVTLPADPSAGSVGAPLPGCHIKLVDIPEMNYYVKDNVGEICGKAAFVMKGYYKELVKTAEALDEDGWLHTGDVGTWLPNGTLKIVDRKKNIFKLSQGEYIATEKIENVYQGSSFVAQAFVDGDSLKPCLMAVIVPDQLFLDKWTQINKQFPSDLKQFCQMREAKELVLKDILEQGRKADLKGFEQVKDIYLEWNPFTVDNDLLTPTFKNRRPSLRKKYQPIIAELYRKNGI
ncbi:Long-chain-fatty-acid--CoA ligase 5 [Bulinus truncatus]|nr:Long-chain-fatty-acid--CoA ligase 5 [Bulinus truncatus]